ncbi:hypothetical protein RCH33_1708 [Flavobacterium daejeonense]|nr:hypothetical protein RCH33_1708 [Flavobacterium daejeonense]
MLILAANITNFNCIFCPFITSKTFKSCFWLKISCKKINTKLSLVSSVISEPIVNLQKK